MTRGLTHVKLAAAVCGAVLLAPAAAAVAGPSAPGPVDSPAMAARVKAEFLHAWAGYRRYAWGHDELRPLSRQPRDWYGQSLLMTPVDALDTLVLMGLNKQADANRELIATRLDFDKDIDVKTFEITIRLLGGLISAYQLPGDGRLLGKAEDLGARLLPAFNSPTGLPYVYVNLRTGRTRGVHSNPAETGTLLLEFGTLSRLSGIPVYTARPSAPSSRPSGGAQVLVWSAAASMSRPAPGPIPIPASAAASIPTTNTCGSAGACSATRTAGRCGGRASRR
jgi:hypothetical protein